MENIEKFIEKSEKITDIFGRWPSFHDAEVIELNLIRGDVEPENNRYIFPVLTAKLHVWELTNDVNAQGFYVTLKHTLATLRFHDVGDYRMEGFNHQNAIFELEIDRQERLEGPSPVFVVNFVPAFGIDATFVCGRIEVMDAVPSSPDGKTFIEDSPSL